MELEFDICQTKFWNQFFFQLKICDSSDSATATYKSLSGDYSLHNRPTTQAIGKIVKKFEETEVVTNVKRPVHHRFTRSSENIPIVSESIAEDRMCRFLVFLRN